MNEESKNHAMVFGVWLMSCGYTGCKLVYSGEDSNYWWKEEDGPFVTTNELYNKFIEEVHG